MALSSHASYQDSVVELVTHWRVVNGALGGAGLVLPGEVDVEVVEGLMLGLREKQQEMQSGENGRQIGENRVDMARAELMERMREFCWMLRTYWAGQAVAAVLPELPKGLSALEHVLRAARRVLRLWTRVNGGPAPAGAAVPLVLPQGEGCGRAEFLAIYEKLLAAQMEEEDAGVDLDLTRAERAGLERRVRGALRDFRALVPLRMGRDSIWAKSLPRLSPLPGHTPERPVVEVVAVEGGLRLSWGPLEEPSLKCWQVRVCRSVNYAVKRERVLATLLPDGPRVWESAAPPGWSFRVYAVLETGNVRGSRTVRVPAAGTGGGTRPGEASMG